MNISYNFYLRYFDSTTQSCLPCLDTWSACSTECYKLFSTSATYNAANNNCANLGGYLALASQKSCCDSVTDSGSQYYWVFIFGYVYHK